VTTTPISDREQAAEVLLRQAHARAYRYPETFAGFEAELTWEFDERAGRGHVTARPGPEIELEVDADGSDREWVERELRSIVSHRQASTYESRDGRHAKRIGEESSHPLGVLIELGDEYDSSYRVSGNELAAVTRTLGGRRFTIVVHERAAMPDGSGLPTAFTVFYWDADTDALAATEAYRDTAAETDGIFLPQSRTIVRGDSDGLSVRRLALTGHELLEGGDR
jgi:Protein of unknown function (DUF3386)